MKEKRVEETSGCKCTAIYYICSNCSPLRLYISHQIISCTVIMPVCNRVWRVSTNVMFPPTAQHSQHFYTFVLYKLASWHRIQRNLQLSQKVFHGSVCFSQDTTLKVLRASILIHNMDCDTEYVQLCLSNISTYIQKYYGHHVQLIL